MTFFHQDQPLNLLQEDMSLVDELTTCLSGTCGWCAQCLADEDARFLLEEM